MGIITCTSCNVRYLGFGPCYLLTVTLGVWYDIEATIFAARVLQVWITRTGGFPNPIQRDTAIYCLAIASSYGASTSVICASLPGLLWTEGFLKAKGKHRCQ